MIDSDNKIGSSYYANLASTQETIRIAIANNCNPVLSTKFTEDSAVLLHLVSRVLPKIPVIWVDTGYNTRATINYSKDICAELDLNLHVYRPHNHTITIPPALDSQEHSDFVRQVKLEPFKRAFSDLNPDAWISSIRRYQSEHRSTLPVFDRVKGGLVKISPLLEWSPENVKRYREENELPMGPPCFDPTKGEPFRECGLHLNAMHS